MNLFENLQIFNESENKIVSEFKEFLLSKNAQYVASEIGETADGMEVVIYDGDWKHEHRYMQNLINEFFKNKGIDIEIYSEEIGESESDTFSARYNIEFNAKPKEYSADVTPLKFTTEAKLPKAPKYWDSMFRVNAIKAYNNGELTSDNIEEWETKYNGGIKPNPSLGTKEILDYYIKHKDKLEESPSYGGAFDISDTAYFTKDDLDEFSNDVIEKLSDATHTDIIANVVDCYLDEDTNELELTVSFGEYEHTHKEKIDMRKIKVPKDLIKAYSHKFVNDFLWCFTADNEHEEMIKESVDLSEYEYIGPATGYNQGWSLYRKIVDGKGVWVAEHQQTKDVVPINYDQVQGFEPIKLDGIKKLQKDLGDMLLPKQESNNEDYDDNAATFLDNITKEITDATHKFMMSKGFPEDEVKDYSRVDTDVTDDYIKIMVGAELEYDSLFELCKTLDKIIEKEDKDAYFEPECPGRIVAYLFGEKAKESHQEREQALKDKINSLDKVEETNHINVDDKDYATGEEMYNEFVKYLNSLDQIAMDGKDCNWEPSEFNAKNLNADGEIYLECGAYILIYPYINEWAEDYFKVIVVDADTCELNIQLKNGIERIFNKFKTDKWKLTYEG